MAVINTATKTACKTKTIETSPALQALSTAAMLLPGLVAAPAHAGEGDEFSFQYGRYQEGERQYRGIKQSIVNNQLNREIIDIPQDFKPIEVDTIQSSARISLSDRLKLNFNYSQDTWSGATPIATGLGSAGHNAPFVDETGQVVVGASPIVTSVGRGSTDQFFDAQGNALMWLGFSPDGSRLLKKDNELTHVLVSASPETRKQMDMTLSYEWDEAALDLGGGVSLEKDYDSFFINLGGRWDFNQKLTSLSLGGSYTHSSIEALNDPDSHANLSGYIAKGQVKQFGTLLVNDVEILSGERQDWGITLGLSQVLSKDAVLKTSVGYTHSSGFLENPYKATVAYNISPGQIPGPSGELLASFKSFIEQRPDLRRQFTWDLGYVHYINPLDAALHLDYRLSIDDWGINAHTFEAEWVQPLGFGWTIAPRVRYYSQSAADFYHPFLLTRGQISGTGFEDELSRLALMPEHFSSDHRLSGFGALSGGVTLSKEFAKGVTLEAGYEYYAHKGSLKLGGGGEGEYADYDYYTFNAALTVSLSALDHGGFSGDSGHEQHSHHDNQLPAGVMFGHMLNQAGQFMVGYRYRNSRQLGRMLHSTRAVSDQQVHNNACIGKIVHCAIKPIEMEMTTHMLNIMYAPTDWLNLMLMPQFVTKTMDMGFLKGASASDINDEPEGPDGIPAETRFNATQHTFHQHESGSLGDVGMYVLLRLFDIPGHHLHISFGATAPTGDTDLTLRRVHTTDIGFTHYGMQTGSGTWDLKPGITYTGDADDWFWGAQVTGTYRLGKNDSGFAFGNDLQASVWGGYQLFNWLSASVRGVYSTQGQIKGEYPDGSHIPIGSMDNPANYGGQYWDLGLGLRASVPSGDLSGMSLGVEWLQPLVDDVNGYQLEREGTLVLNWSYAF